MTTEIVRQELFRRFQSKVVINSIEVMPWYSDPSTRQSWRDQLINTFTGRLRGAHNRSIDPGVIREAEILLQHLHKFTEDQVLWSFTATGELERYGGWGIDSQIVYCMVYDKQESA